jgi:hypothetical protein
MMRIAIYAYPPDPLRELLRKTWRGELNQHLECELVARHAGECPIWDAHITLLDAVSIVEDDHDSFVQAVRNLLIGYLPITLNEPDIREWSWGHNVFLRWIDDASREKLKDLRKDLAGLANKFVITERLDWEKVNELERLVTCLGLDRALRDEMQRVVEDQKRSLTKLEDLAPPILFTSGLRELKKAMLEGWPELLYAPNVSLVWYVEKLANGGNLASGKLPFPPSPHISVATSVREDEKYGWTAKQVGDYIKERLRENLHFKGLLGSGVTQTIDNAYIVEPQHPSKAIEVTVLDRITKELRREFRQPWEPTLRLL